jgi:1-acyl-sn-glycerol-3-phosphate acyltransferase
MDAITKLLAELRGEEPPAERWDPAANNQSKQGRFQARGTEKPKSAAKPAGGTKPGERT